MERPETWLLVDTGLLCGLLKCLKAHAGDGCCTMSIPKTPKLYSLHGLIVQYVKWILVDVKYMWRAKIILIRRITARMPSNLTLNLKEFLLGAFLNSLKHKWAFLFFYLLICLTGYPSHFRENQKTHSLVSVFCNLTVLRLWFKVNVRISQFPNSLFLC